MALSGDDATVFVADTAADTVFEVDADGGSPVPLPGTAGTAPRNLVVAGDQLYLTGTDPVSGDPAVMVLPTAGGDPTVVAAGLDEPDGVAVAADGTVFVADPGAGAVLRVVKETPSRSCVTSATQRG